MTEANLEPMVWYAAGYAYAILIGHWSIRWLAAAMLLPEDKQRADQPADDNDEDLGHSLILPPAVGMIERALYVSGLLAGQGAIIGVWLALKAIGTGAFRGKARHVYQRFLIGSAASVLYAAAAYQGITWLNDKPRHATWAVGTALVLPAGLWLLTIYISRRMPGGKSTTNHDQAAPTA